MLEFPKVALVILNWNGLKDTIECLESLKKIKYPNYEIVVVDNGSQENDFHAITERYRNSITIIRNEINSGFAEGNNIAIRYELENSNFDYILLLNNDTIVDDNFLNEMINLSKEDSSIGIIGPKIYFYNDSKRLQFTSASIDLTKGTIRHIGAGEIDHGQYDRPLETDYAPGSCFLIKREVIEKIGVLDPNYFCYWEETDFCQRVKKGGYRILFCPQAKIWHKGSVTSGKINGFFEYYFTKNRFRFMRKHTTRRQFSLFVLWFFINPSEFLLRMGILLLYHRNLRASFSFLSGIKEGIVIKI